MMCREKLDTVKDRETERALQRIATRCLPVFYESVFYIVRTKCHSCCHDVFFLLRGVVQLFNAVRKHQKMMDDKVKEVGGSERKKAKILCSVSKKDFIDVLKTEGGSSSTDKAEKDTVSSVISYSLVVCYVVGGYMYPSKIDILLYGYTLFMTILPGKMSRNTHSSVSFL